MAALSEKDITRYHPERYKLTRPYVNQAIALYRNPSKVGFHGFTLDNMNQFASLVIKEYNSQILSVDRLERPLNNSALINDEITITDSFCSFALCGNNIFHLTPTLVEEFRQTDIGGVPLDSVDFPYESFYVSFGPQEDLLLDAHTNVDGAYISRYHQQAIQIRITGSRRDKKDSLKGSKYFLSPAAYYNLNIPTDEPEASLEALVDRAIREEIEGNMAIPKQPPMVIPGGPTIVDVSDRSAETRIEKMSTRYPLFRETLNILVNAICYITAYREDIETIENEEFTQLNLARTMASSKRARRKINNRLANSLPYTTIKYCGLSLENNRAQTLGKGSERRSHWRRGHWRHQRSGVGRTIVSLKWIRPMLIHADKGDSPAGHIYLEDRSPSIDPPKSSLEEDKS